jgi:hypothetical protein
VDRETGPEPTAAGPEGPHDYHGPSRAIVAGLAADPRVPVWIRRAIFSFAIGIAVLIWQDWRWGLTAAAFVAIADTVYRSKTMSLIPAAVRVTSAQRRSRRRLYVLRASGFLAVHARTIPGTDSVIDHLVIGPAGVFALDSERWDRRLPVRTVASDSAAGQVLYHGPFSQKGRLAHARWEAAQAARILSDDLGRDIAVRPAMVIYGPTVPWAVATLRGVDVFSGRGLIRYFRARNRAMRNSRRAQRDMLTWEQAGEIYHSAHRTLPRA